MSTARLICYGARVPDDQALLPSLLEELIGDVNAEAGRVGWSGTAFDDYRLRDGHVSFSVVPGDRPATIEDLRAFRDAKRAQQEQDETQEQERLI